MQATAPAATRPRRADRRLLFVALALGALAAGLTLYYLRSAQAAPAVQTVPMRGVVVAKDDIQPGRKITLPMVEVRSIPQAAVPAEALTAIEKVIDRTVRYPVARGEPITELRLVSSKSGDALSFTIPPGKRAVTVPVNATRSPAALITPGDFVDVLAVMPSAKVAAPGGQDEVSVVLALENPVQVLSVQRNYIQKGEPYETSDRAAPPKEAGVSFLTVAVAPDEALRLAWIVTEARSMTVALRGFGDEQTQVQLAPFSGPLRTR